MASHTSKRASYPEANDLKAVQLYSPVSSPSSTMKELTVDNASPLNIRIHSPDAPSGLYYIANRTFAPHLKLHRGPSKSGPLLGVAYLPLFSTTNTIGLGDPDVSPGSTVWETLARTSTWTHAVYRFESCFGEGQGRRRAFVWRRVRQNPLDDQGDYELFEEGPAEVLLARYESVGVLKWKRRGRLFVLGGLGEAWEAMVVLTLMAVVELSRRRARQRRSKPQFLGVW